MAVNSQSLDWLKVLLVDDSFESLNLIRNMLQDLAVTQIYTAKNGMEAMDLLGIFEGDDALDVVLCDWNMPRMTGLELLKQLRTCDPDLPFIMITGLANYEAVAEAKSYGVTGYIKKPFSVDQLKKKLGLVSRIILHRRNEQAIAASKSY